MKKLSLYIFLVLMVCNTVQALPECKGTDPHKWTNCQGTFTSVSENKYVGGWKDGKPHGQGTFTWTDGDKYVGEYKDGKRNGQGTFTWANGDKYVGELKDGKKHGQGTATFANGTKYVGEYKDGIKHGQGTYTWSDGTKYVGEYKDGKLHGQGTYIYTNGDKYVGEYKDGKRHGQGTFTGTDGGNYVGGFKNGRKYGQGILTYADGTIDKGIWQDGKLEWQLDFDRAKVLNGIWTINQPMDSFLNESESGHNFVDEEIYIYKHQVGFVNADYVCQIVSTEHPFIISRNSKKFGVKENSYVVLRTNCKNNEEKFGFDNIFIANKGSLVFFQYSTHFFFGPPWWTFPLAIEVQNVPNVFHNSFERDEVKFVEIKKVTNVMDEKKYLGKFKHKFKNLN